MFTEVAIAHQGITLAQAFHELHDKGPPNSYAITISRCRRDDLGGIKKSSGNLHVTLVPDGWKDGQSTLLTKDVGKKSMRNLS